MIFPGRAASVPFGELAVPARATNQRPPPAPSRPAFCRTRSEISNFDPNSLLSRSMRKATFTTSPMTAYSLLSADPTLPLPVADEPRGMPFVIYSRRQEHHLTCLQPPQVSVVEMRGRHAQ